MTLAVFVAEAPVENIVGTVVGRSAIDRNNIVVAQHHCAFLPWRYFFGFVDIGLNSVASLT
jgi:hypothetical protein